MKYYKPHQRIIAMALSVVMLLGIMPVSAAGISEGSTGGEIIAFEALPEETVTQAVYLGTSLEDLDLPKTLTATVQLATVTDSEAQETTEQESQAQETEEQQTKENSGKQIIEATVPATWVSSPKYDGDTEGSYVFTASVTGYTLADGVRAPEITVTVGKGAVTAPLITVQATTPSGITVPAAAFTKPEMGDGTVENPYLLDSAEDLNWFNEEVGNGGTSLCAKLTGDITVNAGTVSGSMSDPITWVPIGTVDAPYTGTFDGDGHKISGLYCKGDELAGLFGVSAGTIKNVTVENSYFYAKTISGVCVQNNEDGKLENCVNKCTIAYEDAFNSFGAPASSNVFFKVGGVCAVNNGSLTNCKNEGDITVNSDYQVEKWVSFYNYVGGICGQNAGTLEGCSNSSNITVTNSYDASMGRLIKIYVGGICGQSEGTKTIAQCVNNGAIIVTATRNARANSGIYYYIGGICGITAGDLAQCINKVPITANSTYTNQEGSTVYFETGGICGQNTGSLAQSTNEGEVKSSMKGINGHLSCYSGGICGSNSGTISTSSNTSPLHFEHEGVGIPSCLGGIAGNNLGLVEKCFNTASGALTGTANETDAQTKMGGIAGYNNINGCLKSSYSMGAVSQIGGNTKFANSICGMTDDKTVIDRCFGLTGTATKTHDIFNKPSMIDCAFKTTDQFAGGEVTYLLNGITGGDIWYQNIDEGTPDDVPVMDSTHHKVYYYSGIYSNGDCPHTNADPITGFCPDCNTYSGKPERGKGTETEPYVLENSKNLYWFSALIRGQEGLSANPAAHAVLTSDITVNTEMMSGISSSATVWNTIGTTGIPFAGSIDGRGHTVSGLYFNDKVSRFAGFVGRISPEASIKNITIANSYFNGNNCVGAVCGGCEIDNFKGNGELSNCHTLGDVKVNGGYYVGGIIGHNKLAISGCTNKAQVSANTCAGGIAATSVCVSITNCENHGEIIGGSSFLELPLWGPQNNSLKGAFFGGIVGAFTGITSGNVATISNSINKGAVSATSVYGSIGGIAGGISLSAEVKNCYNTAEINAPNANGITEADSYNSRVGGVGGVVGTIYGNTGHAAGNVKQCHNVGRITGKNIVGGVIGNYFSGAKDSTKNCFSLEGTANDVVGNVSTSVSLTNVSFKTAEEFQNGSLIEALNSDGAVWEQGADYPIFLRTELEVSGVSVSGKTYDGTPVSYSGTPTAKLDGVTKTVAGFTYTWQRKESDSSYTNIPGNIAPKKAGNYRLAVSVSNAELIYRGSQHVDFTINKATPVVSLHSTVSGETGSHSATLTVTVTGVDNGETPTGTIKFVNSTSGSDEDIAGATSVAIINCKSVFEWMGLAGQMYKVKAVYSGNDNYNTASEVLEFNTNKKKQATLIIGYIGTKTYGDSSFTLTTSGGSGSGAVTFQSSDSTIISISGTAATIHNAGTVEITATKAEDDTYYETSASVSMTVAKAVPTIEFEAITREEAPFVYGEGIYFNAIVKGVNNERPDGTVTFMDGNKIITTEEFDSLPYPSYGSGGKYLAAGDHSFTAVYNPSSDGTGKNYNGAVSAVVEQAIAKANQDVLSIKEVIDQKYAPIILSLSTTGGSGTGEVTYSVPKDNGVLSVNNNAVTIIGAGKVIVTAIKAADNNYNRTTATREINIGKADAPTITFPTAGSLTYGQKLSECALSGGSTQYGTFAWEEWDVVPAVNGGTNYSNVIFRPNADTIRNYETITDTKKGTSFAVSKATPAVTVTATVSGDAGSRYASLTVAVIPVGSGVYPCGTLRFVDCTNGSEVDIEGATAVHMTGSQTTYTWTGLADQIYKVKAVYSGDDNYNTASSGELSFDPHKKEQQPLTIDNIGTKTYGDGSFTLTTNGGSGNGVVTFESSDPAIVSISDNMATIHKAGAVTITATKAADSNYNEATAYVSLVVGKKALTVTADDKLNVVKGTAMPIFTFRVGDKELVGSDTFTAPTMTTTATDTNTIGVYPITISGGTLTNTDSYTITYVNGTLEIVKAIHAVTVTNGTGSGSYSEGQIVTITANNRSGYTFSSWSSSDGVTFANDKAKTTTFIMPGKAVAVTANYSKNSSGGDGGSSSGGSSSGGNVSDNTKPTIPIETKPDMPIMAKMSVSGTVKDGNLSATITEQMVKDAIKAAQDAAKKFGKEVGGIALNFDITGSGSYSSLSTTIDAGAIDRLREAGVKFVKIGSTVLDVTLDTGAIAEIDKQSSGTVTVSAKAQAKLSDAAKKLIGKRPAFDITVSYQKNGKTEYVTSFGKGTVTLGIGYKAAANEKTGGLYGVYVDKNGKPQLLSNSSYADGKVIFGRNSLSTYGVGYKAPAPAFTDTVKHWAKDNIDFVAGRDLISGTSTTTFAPDTAITRATFLMALGKLSGEDVSGYKTSGFTDVKNTDPTMPYIEWAVKNKIVQGIGSSKFGPDQQISRQDMAVMMVNYANATGCKLPVSRQAIAFADDAKISVYARDAVKAIQQAVVAGGKDNNRFDPQGNATRGEASTILRHFVELVVDKGM